MRFVLLLLAVSGWSLLSGQETIRTVVDRFADRAELRNAVISIDVREVESGLRIASYDPEIACIPASTQKLITTAAALEILGPDHRFRTRLMTSGPVENGILKGSLVIVGGGDPSLGSPFMDGVTGLKEVISQWVVATRNAGITTIEGAVIGDGSYYGNDGNGYAWPWSDLGNYYGAGSYGINLHENSYFLYFTQRQSEGSVPPIHRLEPEVPGLQLNNELRSGPRGSGDQAYIYGAPFNYHNFVRGTIPVGTGRFRIRGSLPDPALFAAQALHRELEKAGIRIVQSPTTHRSVGGGDYLAGSLLGEWKSPPLIDIIDRTNLRSNNLYAETLLRELNKSRGKADHELADTELVIGWLGGYGLNTDGIQLQDGSGLATRNFFSASFMVDFLLTQAGNARWRASIPLAGRTGSLRGALKGTAAEGRVSAKSGSLNAARAYAGYARRSDGRELAFSIMVNNYTLSGKKLNQLMQGLMADLCSAGF